MRASLEAAASRARPSSAAAVGGPAIPPLPVRRTTVQRQSCNHRKRPQAGSGAAEGAERWRSCRACLATARTKPKTAEPRPAPARRGRLLLSRRAALCHRPEGVGAGRPQCRRRRAAARHLAGARQGRAGAAGADLAAGARATCSLARSSGPARRGRRRAIAVSLAWRERTPVAAAFRARAEGPGGAGRPRSANASSACAAPCLRQPSACSAAPICARCSRCSAMPTFRRRRSTPMSAASG